MEPLPNISNLSGITLADRHLKLTWQWPPSIDIAYLCLRPDKMPTGPEDPEADVKRVARAVYERHFGQILERTKPDGTLFARVFAAKNFETGWQFANGENEDSQLEVPLEHTRSILYDVPKPFNFFSRTKRDHAEIRITSDMETVLPELLVCCRPADEGPQLKPTDGPPHQIVEAGAICGPQRPFKFDVPLPYTGTELVWRIFVADPHIARWMNLSPKAGRLTEAVCEAGKAILREI
jgi:hypothetical protein